jgi:(1->4)-alpha-D-glucan 1-alpha-D-glucosylmutase
LLCVAFDACAPGSLHGYDVTDHSIINPEIGGEEQLIEFAHGLRTRGMGAKLVIGDVLDDQCRSTAAEINEKVA